MQIHVLVAAQLTDALLLVVGAAAGLSRPATPLSAWLTYAPK